MTKLTLEEVVVDMEYVSALEKAFMISGDSKTEEESLEKKMAETVLENKGVANLGEYFRSRLLELNLVNIQFFGETEMQKNFCIGKFFYIFNKFSALETLNLKSVMNAPHALKCLAS